MGTKLNEKLRQVADMLIAINAENRPSDTTPDQWSRMQTNVVVGNTEAILFGTHTGIMGGRAARIREYLAQHGFKSEACLEELRLFRVAQLAQWRAA